MFPYTITFGDQTIRVNNAQELKELTLATYRAGEDYAKSCYGDMDSPLDAAAKVLSLKGGFVEAVKTYRVIANCGLKEAFDAVRELQNKMCILDT